MHIPIPARRIAQSLSSNSPTILSGLAVAGVIGTAILAVRATPKAVQIINAEEGEARVSTGDESYTTNNRRRVELTWKFYIPAAISGAATIGCIIGANQIGMRRNAALLGAYTLVDTAFREYKDEVLAQIGVTKERKVHDEIEKRHIDEHPVRDAQVIITGGGDQLCYDTLTGRYFKSDAETIRRAENEINRRVISDMYISQNEFYDLLGLGPTTVGDELGWNLDNLISLVFTSHLAQDGMPCLAVGYAKLPIKDYGKF